MDIRRVSGKIERNIQTSLPDGETARVWIPALKDLVDFGGRPATLLLLLLARQATFRSVNIDNVRSQD